MSNETALLTAQPNINPLFIKSVNKVNGIKVLVSKEKLRVALQSRNVTIFLQDFASFIKQVLEQVYMASHIYQVSYCKSQIAYLK